MQVPCPELRRCIICKWWLEVVVMSSCIPHSPILGDPRVSSRSSAAVAIWVSRHLESGGAVPGGFEPASFFVALHSCAWHVRAELNGFDWYGRWHRLRSYLVESNLGIIGWAISRWGIYGDFDDLHTAGLDGLLKAVDRFDPWRGWQFSTYAGWVIRGTLTDFVRRERKSGLVRQLAEEGQIPSRPSSPVPGSSPADGVLRWALAENLGYLTDRERLVISMRFPLDGSRCHTLVEIADVFGLTRERIRQIQIVALAKIRKAMEGLERSSGGV